MPGSELTHLHELTISAITKEKTKAKTEGMRPNCEKAWNKRLGQTYSTEAWDAVWTSVSNPITNDDDDKTWFKVVHSALNVHNRNPQKSSECRMPGCTAEEGIAHLVRCPKYKTVWKKAMDFLWQQGSRDRRDASCRPLRVS